MTAQPTATALVPGAVPQGKTVNVQITGSGFPANFTTAGGLVSLGPSITVNTVTRNSATKLTANITIGIAATLGPRDVTVTNPDGGAATCGVCFTVNEMPAITSVTPASGGQGVVHRAISVTGTGFQTGVTASIAGGGVTVNSVTRNNSTSLTLDVTVANAAATGARNLVVTNADTGTVTCAGCFAVGLRPTISGTAPNSPRLEAPTRLSSRARGSRRGGHVLWWRDPGELGRREHHDLTLNVTDREQRDQEFPRRQSHQPRHGHGDQDERIQGAGRHDDHDDAARLDDHIDAGRLTSRRGAVTATSRGNCG